MLKLLVLSTNLSFKFIFYFKYFEQIIFPPKVIS
jgi:hypothetical protein